MKEGKESLRRTFEAQTDIIIEQKDEWKKYAQWLEAFNVKKFGNDIVEENKMLRQQIRKAMDILEYGITH